MQYNLNKPEVLAPAGAWECAKAAVENGADAIYFGVGRFNARVRADNFKADELPELMHFLHRRGVRGYVTFNTLIFSNELDSAEQELRKIIEAGVDAAIVQDVGIARLIREISPDFPIHASTQMTISSSAGIRFAQELGASLAVLSRECSVKEIASMKQALPLEVFVHGALCVAYSGQCLTSESLGGRSANRGECAQACRLPYEIVCDGQIQKLDGKRYLLSPQDLCGIEMLPELMQLGVRSLKIEGRLKSPEYVAGITQVYRDCVDTLYPLLCTGTPLPKLKEIAQTLREKHRYALEMAFSRGLYTGWLGGINNKELVHARFGKKRGVFLGTVDGFAKTGIFSHLKAPLKPGDGIVFDSGKPEEREEGGYVYGVEKARNDESFIQFAREGIRWERVHRGDKIWKTSDPALTKLLRDSFSGERPHNSRPVTLYIKAEPGKKLFAEIRDTNGISAQIESPKELVTATTKPATKESLEENFGRLGNTGLYLAELNAEILGKPLVPASLANQLRRELIEKFFKLKESSVKWTLTPSLKKQEEHTPQSIDRTTREHPPKLIPVIRELPQLEKALELGFKEIYGEFESPKDYKIAVEKAHAAQAEFWAQAPRIFKENESGILQHVKNCGADGFLVRNHEHLLAFTGRLRGDFSLNIANHLSAKYFLGKGLESLTASYDMNLEQLCSLLENIPNPEKIEVTLHQHMPMFHMEHCVFCTFLSAGTDFKNCGRPCEKHNVKLRDRTGLEHLLKADAACRNTLYNARAQTGAEFFDEIASRGVKRYRIEFVDESPNLVEEILLRYSELLAKKINGSELWRSLRLESQLGVTRGTLKASS